MQLVSVTRTARHTQALAVANELHAVLVHPHQTYWVHVGEDATVESTGSNLIGQNKLHSDPIHILLLEEKETIITYLSIHIGDATVALSCSIKFTNLCHPKTFCKSLPYTRAQTVSNRQTNFVAFLCWSYWLREKVTANFPNILHHLDWKVVLLLWHYLLKMNELVISQKMTLLISSYSAVVLDAFFPEATGGELLLHYHRESMHQTLTNSHDITWEEETGKKQVHKSKGKSCIHQRWRWHHTPAEW